MPGSPDQDPCGPFSCYFGPRERPLFGWYHPSHAASSSRATGVVICNPLGYEENCAHRSLRHFAETAARAGYPALRFDYDGTGDSAGEDLDPDRWLAWQRSVCAAADELRSLSGVERICLVGVRLGAMIVALAAGTRADVVGFAAIAPVINGREWLREVRILQATMGRPAPPAEFAPAGDVTESVGLQLAAETRHAIRDVDLLALSVAPARECLVLDRDDRPANDRWCQRLQETGAHVRHEILPGYVEMTLDPHEAQVPERMLARFRQWIEERLPEERCAPSPRPAMYPGPVQVAPGIEALALRFGGARRLFGVLTAPQGASPSRALLLLNAGANHHVGNGRMYVTFARRLAREGWLVLRYDVSGIGDSPPRRGRSENDVYTSNAMDDLAAAIELVRSRPRVDHVEVAGLCSGAYHGFRGAVAGLQLDGVTVINPLVFFWKDGMSLAYPPFQMVQAAAQYQQSVLQASKWLKLLRGQVRLRPIAKVLAHRAADRFAATWRNVRRAIGSPAREDLGVELRIVGQQRRILRFIFSVGDPGETLLRSGAGSMLRRLEQQGRITVSHLPDCDHSFSSAWMHEALWRELARGLGPA